VGDAARDWWSPSGTIAMYGEDQAVTFLSFAGLQSMVPPQFQYGWGRLSTQALEQLPAAAFALKVGPQVVTDTNLDQWQWLLDANDVPRQVPLMPAQSGEALQPFFPQLEENYTFAHGNVHVTVFDSGNVTRRWLRQALRNGYDWNVVVMHNAAPATRRWVNRMLRREGVDLVIAEQMEDGALVVEHNGVTFVTAGRSDVFGAFTAQGNRLSYEAWRMGDDGTLTVAAQFEAIR